MTRMFLILLIAVVLVSCSGLRMPTSPIKAFGSKVMSMPNTAGMIAAAAATPLVLTPTAAMADAGGVGLVAVPLLISIFVMVPFLWYQQQLKPKPRKVQQIPIDENLREIKTPRKK